MAAPLSRKGLLLECDEPLKRYLKYINDEKTAPSNQFIITELDDTHLFIKEVSPDMTVFLQRIIDDWHDKNSFQDDADTEAEQNAGKKAKSRKGKAGV